MALRLGNEYGFGIPDDTRKTLDRSRYPRMPESVRIKFDRLVQELINASSNHETEVMVLDKLNTAEIIDLNVIPLDGHNIQSPGDPRSGHALMSTLAIKCGITRTEWGLIYPRLGHLESTMDSEYNSGVPGFVSFYVDTV